MTERPSTRAWYRRRDTPFVLFVLWAITTFTLTHWPALEVPVIVTRTDLVAHVSVFGLWTILCGVAAFFGPRWSRANIGTTAAVTLTYAAIDEGLQAIPFLHRTAALDDFGGDALGVLAGTIFLAAFAWHTRRGE